MKECLLFLKSLESIEHRCEVRVQLEIKKMPLKSCLTIECPSSVVQHLMSIIHKHYMEELNVFGSKEGPRISVAAYLTPKYWHPERSHSINQMLKGRCSVYQLHKYQRSHQHHQFVKRLDLLPSRSCKYALLLTPISIDPSSQLFSSRCYYEAKGDQLKQYLLSVAPTAVTENSAATVLINASYWEKTKEAVEIPKPSQANLPGPGNQNNQGNQPGPGNLNNQGGQSSKKPVPGDKQPKPSDPKQGGESERKLSGGP